MTTLLCMPCFFCVENPAAAPVIVAAVVAVDKPAVPASVASRLFGAKSPIAAAEEAPRRGLYWNLVAAERKAR